MSQESRRTGQQADSYTLKQFAADLNLPESFLCDCGIYTVDTEKGSQVAIPYHNADGAVVYTEYRTSREQNSANEHDGRHHLYGLDWSRKSLMSSYCHLVARVEDVLVAHFNGVAAVAFGQATQWQRQWTPLFKSLPFVFGVFDVKKHVSFLRALAVSPLARKTCVCVVGCPPDEQIFELHKSDPAALKRHWEGDYYEVFQVALLSLAKIEAAVRASVQTEVVAAAED